MAEIDPLIVELVAKVNRFDADLKRATRTVDQQLGIQEKRVKGLEAQFRSSSSAISASLKGLAGTLATAFTGRELVGLIDSYTRLQNQLRVAGLEGQALADVQERLRVIGRTYGADLESLATTFSRIAQVQGDLGASTEDIIRLNEIVAASLKVAGTDAQTASGALLQLGQAFGSGVVRAEEFNSILEGALPLAQAAARGIDGYGGSVAKLRAAIAEGKVTSQEFFQGILRGGVQTIKDAENATLTLSGAFTTLRNELTTYVGSNAAATGATGLLAGAIGELADNIDLVAEALAVITIAIGARFVAGLGAAAVSSIALSGALAGTATQMGVVGAASFALQARLAGAATSMQALSFAAAGARASLSAAFGGPIGLAVGALTIGLSALAFASEDAAVKTQRLASAADEAEATTRLYAQRLRDAGVQVEDTGKGADVAGKKVAGFAGQMLAAADAALKMADALRVADLAKIGSRLTEIQAERADIARINRLRATDPKRPFNDPEGIFGDDRRRERAQQDAALAREQSTLLERARIIQAGAAAGVDVTQDRPRSASPAAGGKSKAEGSRSAASGPSAADRAARFLDEQARLDAEILQAKIGLATSIEDRAALEREFLTLQGDQRRADIDAQVAAKQLTAEQGKALKAQIDALYGAAAQVDEQGKVVATFNNSLLAREVAFREQAEIEQRNLELAEERGRAVIDGLRLQFDLATTEKDRRRIALQILEAEQGLLRERLQAQINSKTLNDVDKERARIALAALDAQAAAQEESVKRQFANPLERFADRAGDAETRVQEAAVRRIEQLNATIADAMTNALGVEDPFLRELISIFLDKNIFGPLAEALSNSDLQGNGGGIVAGIGSLLGSLFGRSSGGRVNAGSIYRVNEGASPGRVEAFVPNTSGQIIPLGRMNALAQGGGGGGSGTVRVVIEEAPGFAARVRTEATGVAIEVTRQTAPQIIDAAANETLRRANRPSL